MSTPARGERLKELLFPDGAVAVYDWEDIDRPDPRRYFRGKSWEIPYSNKGETILVQVDGIQRGDGTVERVIVLEHNELTAAEAREVAAALNAAADEVEHRTRTAGEGVQCVDCPMGGTVYASRTEAIQRVIVDPIEASGEVQNVWDEFDIDAIAAKVLGGYEQGYRCLVDADTFWRIVAGHNRRPVDSDIR
ncbi:hypothetical protein [Mycolicibacterium thermoresistibile]